MVLSHFEEGSWTDAKTAAVRVGSVVVVFGLVVCFLRRRWRRAKLERRRKAEDAICEAAIRWHGAYRAATHWRAHGDGQPGSYVLERSSTEGFGVTFENLYPDAISAQGAQRARKYMCMVRSLVPGGAAERSGQVRPGHLLVQVGDKSMRGVPFDRVPEEFQAQEALQLRLASVGPNDQEEHICGQLGHSSSSMRLLRASKLVGTDLGLWTEHYHRAVKSRKCDSDRTPQSGDSARRAMIEADAEPEPVSKLTKIMVMVVMPLGLVGLSMAGVMLFDVGPVLQKVQDTGGYAPLVLAAIVAVATVLFVPAIVLTLGAGFIFNAQYGLSLGVVVGTATVFIGASLGSILAFALGRTCLKSIVTRMIHGSRLFTAIDRALAANGLKFMLLMRLSPLIPFNALNYAAGVLSVSFRDYTLGCVGMLPGCAAFVYLGAGLENLSSTKKSDDGASGDSDAGIIDKIVWGLGVGFALLAVVLVSRAAKKELAKVIEEDQPRHEEQLKDSVRLMVDDLVQSHREVNVECSTKKKSIQDDEEGEVLNPIASQPAYAPSKRRQVQLANEASERAILPLASSTSANAKAHAGPSYQGRLRLTRETSEAALQTLTARSAALSSHSKSRLWSKDHKTGQISLNVSSRRLGGAPASRPLPAPVDCAAAMTTDTDTTNQALSREERRDAMRNRSKDLEARSRMI